MVGEGGQVERREYVLEGERFHLELRRNFFNVRVVKVWNGLPDYVKQAFNVNAFKTRIDMHMKSNKLEDSQ